MAKKTSSGFADKIRKGYEANKNNETKVPGGGALPAGIDNGIARLVDCRFSQYEKGQMKGEWFFYAAAQVVSPESVEGVRVRGKRTSVMEPIADTPRRSRKTVDDHIAWVINLFQLLGVDTSKTTADQLEDIAAALKKQKPYIVFRTWKGAKQEAEKRANGKWYVGDKGPYASLEALKKANPYVGQEPMTQETWEGLADYTEEEDDDVEEANDTDDESETTEDSDDVETAEDTEDLDALAEAADSGEDAEAQERLYVIAEENGITRGTVDTVATWSEVVEMIRSAEEGADDEEETEEEEEVEEEETEDIEIVVPEKGDMGYYKPKGKRKEVEVEVSAVFERSGKCNLKDVESGHIYKNVEFDHLRFE